MMLYTIIAIAMGASLGAILRWYVSLKFNTIEATIPLGTLSVNLLGGYLIGFAVGFFANNLTLSPEWRLFVITGFLGGLTTFSTFSAEVVNLLQQSRALGAMMIVGAHTIGSIIMTFLGILTYTYFFAK